MVECRFVLDASITMAWCFEDEANPYADAVLDSMTHATGLVPPIWSLEVSNVLIVAERRGRIDKAGATRFISLLMQLPILFEPETPQRVFSDVFALARQHGLSSYDASYLDLALRAGVPLATLDEDLRRAAVQAGVTV